LEKLPAVLKTLEDLYDLIAVLTSEEVEYFRLFAVSQLMGPTANQATLFEALLDETKRNSGHINRIQVDEEVAEGLSRELRRSLRFLYDERDIQSQIRSRIAEAQMLQDKCLFDQSDATLRKARELARHFERFYEALEIINLQKSSLQHILSLEEATLRRQELEADESEVWQLLHNYTAYRNLAKEVTEVYRRPEMSDEGSRLDLLERIFVQPLLRDEKLAQTFTARYYFLHLRSTYAYFLGDLPMAWDQSSRLLHLLRQKPFLIDLSQDGFMVSFFNNLTLTLELGEYDEFANRLEEFRQMPGSLVRFESPRFRQRVLERACFLEIKYFLHRALYVEGLQRTQRVADQLRDGSLRPDPYFEAQFYFLFAYFAYLNQQPDQAQTWIDRILDVPEFREDARVSALVLRHIIAFEQGDRRIFDQELPSTYFFLEHSQRGLTVERTFLFALHRAFRASSPEAVRETFVELREELQTLRENPFEKNHLSSFDVVCWLDSQLSGEPFAEVFARRESAEKFRVMR